MEKILILMSTYNGEKYLCEQITSLLKQEGVSVRILVRDDGSSDNTTSLLNEYQRQGHLRWYSGTNLRPAKSFMNLLINAPEEEYYAFCDQDDVWMPEKLKVAIEKIKGINGPALYCSDTILVDSHLNLIRKANLKAEGSFVESLISNPVTGCTMVFNKALRDIVIQYEPDVIDMHDWWIYRVCMAIGGFYYFDKTPQIKYRQHGANVVGGQNSMMKVIKRRISYLLRPSIGIRYAMAHELYIGYYSLMSDKNREILDMFVAYKDSFANTIKLAFSNQIVLDNHILKRNFRNAVLLRKF